MTNLPAGEHQSYHYRALVCKKWDSGDDLEIVELERQPLAAGDVRIAVKSATITFADGLKTRGLYQIRLPVPFTPGGCGAGDVIEIGPGVENVAVGDRVTFLNIQGACGEELVSTSDSLTPIPDGMSYFDANAVRLYYPTVYFALAIQGRLQPGETLAVTGAGGANGLAAIHLGKALGARVIGCASTPARLAAAKEAGADAVVDYGDGHFAEKLKEVNHGKGADVVFEVVGGNIFDEAVRATADMGRVVIFGFAGGEIPTFKVNRALLRNIAVVGANFQRYGIASRPDALVEIWDMLCNWMQQGKLAPPLFDHFALDDAPEVVRKIWQGPLDRPALIDMELAPAR